MLSLWRSMGKENQRPTYRRTRSMFLRGLGLVYVAAFGSMAVQVDGLIGSHGILPAADYLERARQILGPGAATYWRLPTLLWLDSSDHALHALCWGGVLHGEHCSSPGSCPGCAPACSGSFTSRSSWRARSFWAISGTLCFWRRGCWRCSWHPGGFGWAQAPKSLGGSPIWLVRWLAFSPDVPVGRGQAGEPATSAWSGWSALEFHYETQPLPAWTSWYIHQMPCVVSLGFRWGSCSMPSWWRSFFIFGPRPIRRVGFASLMLLQLLIAATGNYGFFNLLSMVLCLTRAGRPRLGMAADES